MYVVSKLVVGVWDGLDESEISRLEILSQSAPESNTSFETVKGLILIVYTRNINKALCFC